MTPGCWPKVLKRITIASRVVLRNKYDEHERLKRQNAIILA